MKKLEKTYKKHQIHCFPQVFEGFFISYSKQIRVHATNDFVFHYVLGGLKILMSPPLAEISIVFQKYLQTNGLLMLPINDFFKKLILNPKEILIFGWNLKFWVRNWPLNQKWWLEICRLLSSHLFRAKNFQDWVIWTKVMTRNYCECKCRHFTETWFLQHTHCQ